MIRNLTLFGILLVVLGGSITALGPNVTGDGTDGGSPGVTRTSDVLNSPAVDTSPLVEGSPTGGAAEAGNRTECDQIRGTDYRSPDERAWYLENCLR